MSRRDRRNQEQVTLSDLLAFDDDDAVASERPRSKRRWWLRDLAISAVVAGGVYVVIRATGFETPLPVLFAIMFTVMLVRRALTSVPTTPPPPAARSELWGVTDDGAGHSPPVDGVVRAVQRWESRFGWTERDPARFQSAVHPRIYELVDERLRQRHSITLRDDPARARALIGEQLWEFLHTRAARTPSTREMAAVVDEVEKI